MRDLDWAPKFSMLEGLKDSYVNDFKLKKVSAHRCHNAAVLVMMTRHYFYCRLLGSSRLTSPVMT